MDRLRAVAVDATDLERLVRLRRDGEPLQYLEGTAAFGRFDLIVDERVLIPRPETEQLWELATESVASPKIIVDLCTGSGALAIALADSFPDARVIGTDLSAEAIEVATLNGASIDNVEFRHGDLYEALDEDLAGRVDLLVSNPPYVAEMDYPALPADVRREPRMALVAGPTGLEVYGRLAEGLDRWLSPGGVFVFEIGESQAAGVSQILDGFETTVHQDLAGRDRFVKGRKR
jgi:release factor glutamine methyltransferase